MARFEIQKLARLPLPVVLDKAAICSLTPNAFHEKAGRSQVGSFVFRFMGKVFFPFDPGRRCRNPSIRTLEERFSLGASWAFSLQPVLPPVSRPLFHSGE